jgi:hypothetical protein
VIEREQRRGQHEANRATSPPTASFRPFDLLLLAGVLVIAAGVALRSRGLPTAAGLARRAMERETVAELTIAIVVVIGVVVLVALLVGAGVVRRRRTHVRTSRPVS